MLRKIYEELAAIRKELKGLNGNRKHTEDLVLVRKPYSTSYTICRAGGNETLEAGSSDSGHLTIIYHRFELLTEDEQERIRLERVIDDHDLSGQDLAVILFGLRVRPEFGKKDFGI